MRDLRRTCAPLLGLLVVAGCASGSQMRAPARAPVEIMREVHYTSTTTLDVYRPSAKGRWPVVVLLHGCCGAKEDLAQLAWGVATQGAVVFNASWLATVRGGGYPLVYQQAACAVRFARARAGRYGGDPGRVTLLGWSDGALLAAVIANAGDDFPGDCQVAGVSAVPDALVTVSGFLGWEVRPGRPIMKRYVTERTIRFFGGTTSIAARAWAAGNPYTHLGRNHRLSVRLLVSSADPLLDDNRRFLAALGRAGQRASLRVVDGDPLLLISPRTKQGQITVAETLQVARVGGASG